MAYKRILTVQDISCIGQCSITVALPIISACGHETAILPTAVLSNHTAFSGFTFNDLSVDMPKIKEKWIENGIKFDAIYTGYLGSIPLINAVTSVIEEMSVPGTPLICDPAMADDGVLYANLDEEYAAAMTKLCAKADIVMPNITEAAIMTGLPYKEIYDETYVVELCKSLTSIGMKKIVMTGVSYDADTTGIYIYENGESEYYKHPKIGKSTPGTGDVFASVFTGAYMRGHSVFESAGIAGEFVLECIKGTIDDPSHWYGVKFEPVLGKLIQML